eukprot:m.342030 g.342030  ORF g.342030 m.342030 type:complete len:314 (-) comp20828_c0_seq1:63-1004(-)
MFASQISRALVRGRQAHTLSVAVSQLVQEECMDTMVTKICHSLHEAKANGAQVVAFPEASITSYSPEYIKSLGTEAVSKSIQRVRTTCGEVGISAVVGTVTVIGDGSNLPPYYNSALVIGKAGEVIAQHDKMMLVPPDESFCIPGKSLNTFKVDDVPCGAIVCHDKRFPELVRLPVLAGARVMFYLSCELWHDDFPLPHPRDPAWSSERMERELSVYRAQIQARAVENRVWVVKANLAGDRRNTLSGSHGISCIVDPTGIIVAEAGVFSEEIIYHEINVERACASYALKSLNENYALRDMWIEGLKKVNVPDS